MNKYRIAMENMVDNTAYWNQYYKNRVCSEKPSPFAQFVATLVEPGRQMVELGCGNGRDAVFFASLGLRITALDTSQEAISQLQGRGIANAMFLCDDFVNSDIHRPDSYDYAYSRFPIHAINRNQEQRLLNNVFCGLAENCLSRCAGQATRCLGKASRWSEMHLSMTTTIGDLSL